MLALVHRALGDSVRALELELEAVALGWAGGFEAFVLAYDRVVVGAWDELESSLEEIQESQLLGPKR